MVFCSHFLEYMNCQIQTIKQFTCWVFEILDKKKVHVFLNVIHNIKWVLVFVNYDD